MTDSSVDEYLLAAPSERVPVLTAIRRLCLSQLPDFSEEIRFSMPTYVRADQPEVAWASQKNYIALYIMRTELVTEFKPRLRGLNIGKSCIRYRNPEQVDLGIVRELLERSAVAP
ncbi:MAG: DUF1801 domain-containing protein [Angustibacter sp.]